MLGHPYIKTQRNGSINTAEFGGVNRLKRGKEGELADCRNIGNEYYPCISTSGFTVEGSAGEFRTLISEKQYTKEFTILRSERNTHPNGQDEDTEFFAELSAEGEVKLISKEAEENGDVYRIVYVYEIYSRRGEELTLINDTQTITCYNDAADDEVMYRYHHEVNERVYTVDKIQTVLSMENGFTGVAGGMVYVDGEAREYLGRVRIETTDKVKAIISKGYMYILATHIVDEKMSGSDMFVCDTLKRDINSDDNGKVKLYNNDNTILRSSKTKPYLARIVNLGPSVCQSDEALYGRYVIFAQNNTINGKTAQFENVFKNIGDNLDIRPRGDYNVMSQSGGVVKVDFEGKELLEELQIPTKCIIDAVPTAECGDFYQMCEAAYGTAPYGITIEEIYIRGMMYPIADANASASDVISGDKLGNIRDYNCILVHFEDNAGNIIDPPYFLDGSCAHLVHFGTSYNTTAIELDSVSGSSVGMVEDLCLYKNRMWVPSSESAQVYGSAFGEFGKFGTFEGLSTDSVYIDIATSGDFTALSSYNDSMVIFKSDSMQVLYGDTPSNFQIAKEISGIGCIDRRSIAECGGILYWLGQDGIYRYGGGRPVLISKRLDRRYTEGVAFVQMGKYYLVARYSDGWETVCYDPECDHFYIEDGRELAAAYKQSGEVYIMTPDGVIYLHDLDYNGEWSLETMQLFEGIYESKGINEIIVRAALGEGTSFTLYTKCESDDWQQHFTVSSDIDRLSEPRIYRFPVRFKKGEYYKIKLEGSGACIIYELERTAFAGGYNK